MSINTTTMRLIDGSHIACGRFTEGKYYEAIFVSPSRLLVKDDTGTLILLSDRGFKTV